MTESKKLIADYGLEGEEALEFKLNPWILTVKDATTRTTIRMQFDPNSTCADAIVELMKKFPVVPGNTERKMINPQNHLWLNL